MKIQVCTSCGSPRVFADAYVNLNDEDDVRLYDDTHCNDCGKDGHSLTIEVEVPDDFDIHEDTYDLSQIKEEA